MLYYNISAPHFGVSLKSGKVAILVNTVMYGTLKSAQKVSAGKLNKYNKRLQMFWQLLYVPLIYSL